MIFEEVEKQIEEKQNGEFLYPCYESFCFSSIPSAILYLLGLRKESPLVSILNKAKITPTNSKKVILFLIDGFGYKQWLKYTGQYEFLKRFTERGIVAPITTVFPSTTAAALTTIHSGLTPQEHGLPEWWVYFDELDKIIVTLPFTPIGEKGRDKLLDAGVDPKILFDGKTIHETLSEAKIPSFTFIRDTYANSAYSKTIHRGSETTPFINSSDLLTNLRKKVVEVSTPAYFYVYWDAVDSIAHTYGPHTEQYLAELNGFFYLLQKEFVEKIGNLAEEISIMITADHGQVNVDPKRTIYLNQYSEVVDNFQVGPSGNKILPWGSTRDIFLAIKLEKLDEVFEFLTKIFDAKATIMKIETAFEQGLFGRGNLHKKFQSRVGNLLILPHGNSTIWYEHFKDGKFDLLGMHGGLTAEEMLVPFAVARGDQLI
ncbi:MAG: alkaline phosphatase family protein [Patescibacteria group bacterium]